MECRGRRSNRTSFSPRSRNIGGIAVLSLRLALRHSERRQQGRGKREILVTGVQNKWREADEQLQSIISRKRNAMSQAASQAWAFYREVAKTRLVWTVRDECGFPAPMTSSGKRAQP